jgi:hypothetical protein
MTRDQVCNVISDMSTSDKVEILTCLLDDLAQNVPTEVVGQIAAIGVVHSKQCDSMVEVLMSIIRNIGDDWSRRVTLNQDIPVGVYRCADVSDHPLVRSGL